MRWVSRGTGVCIGVLLALGLLVVFGVGSVGAATGEQAVNMSVGNVSADPIGLVNGVWHNDSIAVNQSDGLSDTEIELLVSRSMARVEYVRELNFESMVNVTVWTREEYRAYVGNQSVSSEYGAWNNEVWRAMFVVDDGSDVQTGLNVARGESVSGMYNFNQDAIVIITDSPDRPVIDNRTLVHELVHALQDQHFNLSRPEYRGGTQDEQLARQGLIEGDAEYVQRRYSDLCGGTWNCTSVPLSAESSGVSSTEINWGIWAVLYQPYSDGPAYIHEIVTEHGWEAVNAMYADPPKTSREIIHREPFNTTAFVYEDTASSEWTRYWDSGVNGTDTVGEASIFVMGWYQTVEYEAGVVEQSDFLSDAHPYSTYDYESRASAGWTNDVVVPYRNNQSEEHGYVWVTTWESYTDASEFVAAYERVLDAHAAQQLDQTTWWLYAEQGFPDAYRVVQDNTTVTVVHGPSIEALEELRPSLAPEHDIPPPPPRFEPPGESAGELPEPSMVPAQPGFSVVGVLMAFVVFISVFRRFSRV